MLVARSFAPQRGYAPHALHAPSRIWPETNCYTDLWIEVLNALGAAPEAMLAFTADQAFEGDQFTFFKPPLGDLQALYGLKVQELAIFDELVAHIEEQVRQDRLVVIELDAFYLPDTEGSSYRREHVKTTIGVAAIDARAASLGYFHNAGYYSLEGEDFRRIFHLAPDQREHADWLFPYVEMVKRQGPGLTGGALVEASLALLRAYLRQNDAAAMMPAFRQRFFAEEAKLLDRSMAQFHAYAFNNLRQAGANAELLASYLEWLGTHGEQGLNAPRDDLLRMAELMKALQFQVARAVHRRKLGEVSSLFAELELCHGRAMSCLAERYG